MRELVLEVQNYEDFFQDVKGLKIDRLEFNVKEISKFASNKLFFDLAQGLIQVVELKLVGFNEENLAKLPMIAQR